MKNKMSLINKDVLDYIIKHSDVCKHAIRELNLAGYNKNIKGPNALIYRQVMEAVALFSSHDNSGLSAPYEIKLVSKLCNFDILTPLTFKDDEWNQIGENEYQNNRIAHIFKDNNGILDGNAFTLKVTHSKYFESDKISINDNNISWHGSCWLIDNNICTGEYLKQYCYLRDSEINKGKYFPLDSIKLKTTEIEVSKDNWLMFVDKNSDEFKILNNGYNLSKSIVHTEYELYGIAGLNINDITLERANKAEEILRKLKNK